MKNIFSKLFILICLFFLVSCSQKNKSSDSKIIIATAANMQFAMKEIVKSFNQQEKTTCDLVISSSGKLTAQIKEGAPYDIFVAANMKYPLEVFKNGLSKTKPKIYAYGKLVLWSMNKQIKPSLEILNNPLVHHIALANPKTAPYGFASVELLKQAALYNRIKNKLVYGESISQTNQFITLQSAEIGFTAMSVVLSPEMKNKGKWIPLDSKSYSPIKQGVVLVTHSNKENPLALKFYNFLFSDTSKKILKNYGYAVN